MTIASASRPALLEVRKLVTEEGVAAWSAVILALATLWRRLGRDGRASVRDHLARLERLIALQDAELDRLRVALEAERSDRIREREFLLNQIAEANRRLYEYEEAERIDRRRVMRRGSHS